MPLAPRATPVLSAALSLCLAASVHTALASAASAPAPFLRIAGAAPGDRFGVSVSAAGDVNGDGHADLVAGSEWSDADAPNAGRAYVYFGGPGTDDVADLTLRVPTVQARALTGYAVAVAGDMNGDGWDDVAVGSPVSQFMGRVFLYWGGPAIDAISDRTLSGLRSLEFFGAALAGVGDATGDGYDDLWVGAPRFVPVTSSTTRVGRGYLFQGGPAGDGIVDVTFEARPIGGVTDELQFGTSVAPAGDVNHDGFRDILVGQPGDGFFNAGRALLHFGGIPVHRLADRVFLPTSFRFRAGTSVTAAGDFNADGVEDHFVGAPDSGEGEELTAGRAYLYFGGQAPVEASAPDLFFAGPAGYDAFGASVAGGIDVSGDGFPDLLVGAPEATGANGERAGKVYVYYGGPGADTTPDVVLEGPARNGTLGTSMTLADFNQDGVADAIIGAAGLQGSASDPGHVFAYDLVAPLPARVAAHDEHRSIPLNDEGGPVCLLVEPIDGSFEIADLDFASLRLLSIDGDLAIEPVPAKSAVAGDSDRNGVPDLGLCFTRSDLRRLLSGSRGRSEGIAVLDGRVFSGRRVAGDVRLNVVSTGRAGDPAASVAPNPMNPEGTLAFTLERAGVVDARLYDASGRLVRRLASGLFMPEGRREIRIDGRDERGRTLPSGIYFFRLRTPGGESSGRVVVAK